MLNITEFTEEEVLRNSDGNILKVYSNNTYVVLWDDNITNEQEVRDFINERKYYNYDIKIYFSNKLVLMRKDEWKDYSVFRDWAIKTGYKENHSRAECSLDRINNDGDYEPSNCRWTDMKTQSNNTRTNTIVCYKGIEKTLSEWADYYKIPYKLFVNRYLKGWTIEEIVNTPKRERRE